ncbi:hypothetical protein [Croceivirga sp. JEA036]|uniref:hypothetical protein n=1 Tax=Croceivirga sp. JEA036 TaxID=2721162 RepID=UPI00143919DC|nr:hypothetical protein [Croceivirga sp. JEA036]NJB38108.1 hypothetical protein [Croceivirga sp. JEA036]
MNVLLSCDQWKSHNGATPLLTFESENEIQVFDHIKANLKLFFDGSKKTREHKFHNFFMDTIEKNTLAEAINGNPDILAMVQQIPNL